MGSDDSVAEGFGDGFGFGVDVQLFVDAANVVSHGVDAYVEAFGGALIAVPFR